MCLVYFYIIPSLEVLMATGALSGHLCAFWFDSVSSGLSVLLWYLKVLSRVTSPLVQEVSLLSGYWNLGLKSGVFSNPEALGKALLSPLEGSGPEKAQCCRVWAGG